MRCLNVLIPNAIECTTLWFKEHIMIFSWWQTVRSINEDSTCIWIWFSVHWKIKFWVLKILFGYTYYTFLWKNDQESCILHWLVNIWTKCIYIQIIMNEVLRTQTSTYRYQLYNPPITWIQSIISAIILKPS